MKTPGGRPACIEVSNVSGTLEVRVVTDHDCTTARTEDYQEVQLVTRQLTDVSKFVDGQCTGSWRVGNPLPPPSGKP